MFIETRFYDSGKVTARLHKGETEPEIRTSGRYDNYIEEIGDLREWIQNNLHIEPDSVIDFVRSLDSGGWIDMTNFC